MTSSLLGSQRSKERIVLRKTQIDPISPADLCNPFFAFKPLSSNPTFEPQFSNLAFGCQPQASADCNIK
ncbi:hypothetical protein C1H46_020122 [Malus baccata]|uniref:Uncharacterized protein n=1 Tax=Malus baccata TaxID=106549 RepID=A0A540M6J2_MALBA|nr:hypothetical protein C1H46_020122 [Malus baccata]